MAGGPGGAASKKQDEPKKSKKEVPQELCGCGVDTYRPPPKGKKPVQPVLHLQGCPYQRRPCRFYPHLPPCAVCANVAGDGGGNCKYCGGLERWCPHCYEKRCTFLYERVVIGWGEMAAAVKKRAAQLAEEAAAAAPS